jgi:hypothetical protein
MNTELLALTPSGSRITVWTVSRAEATEVAQAFHEARPGWRVHIDGQQAVFSREGTVVDFVSAERKAR